MAEENFESDDFLVPEDLLNDLGGRTLDQIKDSLLDFATHFAENLSERAELIVSDFESKASSGLDPKALEQAVSQDLAKHALKASEVLNHYQASLNKLTESLDEGQLEALTQDIQLINEVLPEEISKYLDGLFEHAKQFSELPPPLSPQEKLKEEGFPIINPEDIDPEEILATIKTEGETKSRQILERYIRDFEKSVSKKLLQVETSVTQFELKGAPRADTEERLNEIVQGMLDKKVADLEQLAITTNKEFDNIDTRLRTMRGVEEDFDEINALKDQIDSIINSAKDEYRIAAESILDRGRESIQSRQENKNQKQAVAEAQEKAEEAYRNYVEENKDTIQPNFGETLMAVVADIISPYSALHRDSDKRYDRLADLQSGAKDAANQVYNESLGEAGFDPDDEGMGGFVTPVGVKGARAGDVKSMARIVRGAGPIIALTAVEFIGRGMQKAANDSIDTITNRDSSTMELAKGATAGIGPFGGNVPFNWAGAFLERVLENTEQIAQNTAQDIQGFSPELITAQVESSMRMLEDNIRRADEMGPLLAGMERSRNDLELAINRLSDSFLKEFGPLLVTLETGIVKLISMGENVPGALRLMMENDPIWGAMWTKLWDIGVQKLNAMQDVDSLPEIEDFLHPNQDNFRRNTNRLGL